ncbi:unnamed protein product [Withania somnifera]
MENQAGKTQKASSSAPPPSPPWVELPLEITAEILRRLGAVEILLNVQRVCTTWRKACYDPTMWRVIDMRNGEDMYMFDVFDKLCRVAVDRSQGQLFKINIQYFGNKSLLEYIAQRSSQLKHLRLVYCDNISNGGLAAVAKNFPLLEELHIYLSAISIVDIESVGRSCSQLKSFTLNNGAFGGWTGFRNLQIDVNDQAMAIAVNMPELRRLALFGNTMTNEGLCAILNGCPLLESLDLRHCYSIDLEGDLGTRCRQQIADLNGQICDYMTSDDEPDLDLRNYFYDYDYGDFEYDDITNPFSGEYLDEGGFFW